MSNNKPLVVHLIYKLDVGGLEKVMLDCIQGTVHKGVEHAVIALTEATEFAQMLPESVQVFSLNKKHQTTLILITHDSALADRCDRRLHLQSGQLHEQQPNGAVV